MKLFSKGTIGEMELKNRIVMTPMGIYGLPSADGNLTDRGIAFYTARARGGTGLIIPTATFASKLFEEFVSVVYIMDSIDKALRWSELVEHVHAYGAKLAIQLSPGLGRINSDYLHNPHRIPVSASPVPAFWSPWVNCRPLEKNEIRTMVESFGKAAYLAKGAGVDAIEIHGYGGYLIDQFATALWNKREDEYGGDLEGRMRFPLELIKSVRDMCGKDFPIIYKFTPVHTIEGGRELPEGIEIAKMLEEAGVDALHVDVGCYEAWHRTIPPVYQPPACQIDIAQAIKKEVSIPVIAHGKLGIPEMAEDVLEEGKADFIGLGRSLLSDPEWANKVKEGRIEDITPCIGCSEGCFSRGFEGKYASCAVNPQCAKETEYPILPAEKPKFVLVLGGGPGGMESSIIAAKRGHRVELWEKEAELGGTLIPASVPEFKMEIRRFIEHKKAQLAKEGVKVKLRKKASADEIISALPDTVIIATGGEPIIPNLPGAKGKNVFTAIEALKGGQELGNRVVVAGGGLVGCETAVHLAQQGKEVLIIEMEDRLLPEPIFILNYKNLMELIEKSGCEVMLSAKLLEIDEEGVIVETFGERKHIDCDSVVLALGFQPIDVEVEKLEGKIEEIFVIGDARKPRKVLNAVWEGFHTARVI